MSEAAVETQTENYRAMEAIASRLATAYPSDWYERLWKGPHLLYLFGIALCCLWVWMESGSTLVGVLPIVAWQLLMVVAPRFFLGRIAYAPRWAHANAKLEPQETHLVNRVSASMGPGFMRAVSPILPVMTGERFWIVLKQARQVWRSR